MARFYSGIVAWAPGAANRRKTVSDLVQAIVHNGAVKRVSIHDAKTNLSRHLAELTPGKALVICNRDRPVAELRLLRKIAVREPRMGVAKGEFLVPDSFFERLPYDMLKAFSDK